MDTNVGSTPNSGREFPPEVEVAKQFLKDYGAAFDVLDSQARLNGTQIALELSRKFPPAKLDDARRIVDAYERGLSVPPQTGGSAKPLAKSVADSAVAVLDAPVPVEERLEALLRAEYARLDTALATPDAAARFPSGGATSVRVSDPETGRAIDVAFRTLGILIRTGTLSQFVLSYLKLPPPQFR